MGQSHTVPPRQYCEWTRFMKYEANVELFLNQQGASSPVAKRSLIVCELMRNALTFHFIYFLSKHTTDEFMVSTTSFKSSLIQLKVHLVNYSPVSNKIDDEAGYVRTGYPPRLHWFLPRYDHLWLQEINKYI